VQEEIDRLRSESDRLRTDANERMLEINSMLREKERWNERAMTAEIAKAAAEASVRAGKERCEELKVEVEKANLEKARYVLWEKRVLDALYSVGSKLLVSGFCV
jgi:predicted  nucleic acid-binding Zn-ribbon protein